MKKLIFRYLDTLFDDSEIRETHSENRTSYRVRYGDETLFATTGTQRRGGSPQIHFSNKEYYFILNTFKLEHGKLVDIIREYVANKFDDPSLIDLPFHPYL